MGARGPKAGSGEVSAWIIQALHAGKKNQYGIRMGSGFTAKQVENALTRLVESKVVRHAKGTEPGDKNRPGGLYELVIEEKNLATNVVYPARSRAKPNAVRLLDDTFRNIVAQRPSPA
jgi:hypothetical protein